MVLFVGGPLLALVLIVAGIFLLPSDNDQAFTKDQIEQLSAKGNRLYGSDRFQEAIAVWEEALSLSEEHGFRSTGRDLQRNIQDARQMISLREDARKEWESFQKESSPLPELKADTRKAYTLSRQSIDLLLKRALELEKQHLPLRVPWMKSSPGKNSASLPEIRIQLKAQWDNIIKMERELLFEGFREKVRHRYLVPEKSDWAGAIRKWKSYVENVRVLPSDIPKAEKAIVNVNRRANGEWHQLKNRSERMNSARAVVILTDALPRFEGCIFNEIDLPGEIRKKIQHLQE